MLKKLSFIFVIAFLLCILGSIKNSNAQSMAGDPVVLDENYREKIGEHDNLHYISNYLELKIQRITIQYRYDLCLCPKWYIKETNEPIWLESTNSDLYPNSSNREYENKEIVVIGYFYKYMAVPLDLFNFEYLSHKNVPNARIFKIE
jgi:hypothetical protein